MRFLYCCWLFLLFGLPASAQKIKSLEFLGAYEIPYGLRFEGTEIGGLSGIAYMNGFYYVVADKPPARIYQLAIQFEDTLYVTIKSVNMMGPDKVSDCEAESIIASPEGNSFFISDEQKEGTRVIKISQDGEIQQMITPGNQMFLPLSSYNSGIEGIDISQDGRYLYYAFERPTFDCHNLDLVNIKKLDLQTGFEASCYYYELHDPPVDPLTSNGVSEILLLDNQTLLLMERAYIPDKGNIVKLYESRLPAEPSYCDDENKSLPTRFIFDFDAVVDLRIDNAEGMCLNEDGSILYIVTDNNFNKTQHTQIVALRVNYY